MPRIHGLGLMVLAQCSNCGAPVWKRFGEHVARKLHYCTRSCYLASPARLLIATHAGKGVIDSATRARIARAGGLGRARTHGPSALSVIGRMGVAARLALPLETRSRINRLVMIAGTMRRFGSFPRGHWAYVLAPAQRRAR